MTTKRFALIFAGLGIAIIWLGFANAPWGLVLIWPGLNFLFLSVAYFLYLPNIFGKRADGTLSPLKLLFLLPYCLFYLAIWHLMRLMLKEDPVNRITDDIYVGRRLLGSELPMGIDTIVDLTCEFAEPHAVRTHPGYVAFPILDGSAPSVEALVHSIRNIAQGNVVFIHCAQGHGRTALYALALLLHRGYAGSVAEGFAKMKAARPGVHLSPGQRRCIMAAELSLVPGKSDGNS